MIVGILAVQGAVGPHEKIFQSLGISTRQIKKPEDLNEVSALILPGGESSSMIRLLKLNGLWEAVEIFVQNKPTWGLCAGSILLAKSVESPSQDSLGILDATVIRNAYGRQNESFIAPLTPTSDWYESAPFEGIFIRAPKISSIGKKVKVLFTHLGEPVMIQEGHTLASTFHPELGESDKLHRYFLRLCQESL